MIRSNHKKKIGDEFLLSPSPIIATIQKVESDGQFKVSFNISETELRDFFFREGLIPIPPYIRQGESDSQDKKDYQTVFAGDEDKQLGSVAAPTAGLHFDQQLLHSLKEKGHETAFVTLHVGLGTFLPVKNESILQHDMHEEAYFIDDNNLTKIQKAYEEKQNIIAVGTTSLRVLESSYSLQKMKIELGSHSIMNKTKIFLYPGKKVSSINGLITNFHLPKSTLLMLVSSLIGREKTLELYEMAIAEKYRFFSYGDAMCILLS
jgi:S-adenosylmethionine:tRNA ribosyltransferase-isomerase